MAARTPKKKKTPPAKKVAEIVKRFAAGVRNRRAALNLSQHALANKTGYSVSYISMLERGQRTPPLDTLEVVAKGLDCNPTYLIG